MIYFRKCVFKGTGTFSIKKFKINKIKTTDTVNEAGGGKLHETSSKISNVEIRFAGPE